jgi:hypothetical protein
MAVLLQVPCSSTATVPLLALSVSQTCDWPPVGMCEWASGTVSILWQYVLCYVWHHKPTPPWATRMGDMHEDVEIVGLQQVLSMLNHSLEIYWLCWGN